MEVPAACRQGGSDTVTKMEMPGLWGAYGSRGAELPGTELGQLRGGASDRVLSQVRSCVL